MGVEKSCAEFGVARQQYLDAVTNYVCQPDISTEIIDAGVVDDLVPLLKDPSLVTQRYVAEFLGRFAEKGVNEAQCIIDLNGVHMLLNRFFKRELPYRRTALYTLTSIGRHSDELTKKIISLGAFAAIIHCLECPNVELNTDAMYALRLLGVHPTCAAKIIKSDIGPLINKCLYSYDDILIQWTLFTVGDIVYESEELADHIEAEKFLDVIKTHILKSCYINSDDIKIWVLHVWSCFATHSAHLATKVVESKALPCIRKSLLSDSDDIRDKALYALIQIAKHNATLANLMLEEEIVDTLLEIADRVSIEQGMMCLDLVGIIASQSAQAASKIVEHPICRAMVTFIKHSKRKDLEADLASSCIWSLGQIGKHSPDLANKLAQVRVIKAIIHIYEDTNQTPELHETCRATLKQLLQKCSNVHILDHFIFDIPLEIQEYVIHGLANLVTSDVSARNALLECGGLLKVIYIPITPGTDLMDDVLKIVYSYPDPIITNGQSRSGSAVMVNGCKQNGFSRGWEKVMKQRRHWYNFETGTHRSARSADSAIKGMYCMNLRRLRNGPPKERDSLETDQPEPKEKKKSGKGRKSIKSAG